MSLKDKIVRTLALRWLRGKTKDLRGKDRETGMGKFLKFIDGWKLVIFTLVLFASRIYDASHNGHTGDIVGAIFAALGMTPEVAVLDPVALGAAVTGALAIWGVFSRVYKAQKQLRAGSSVAGLLSTEGFVSAAVAKAQVSASSANTLTATIDHAEKVADAKAEAAKK